MRNCVENKIKLSRVIIVNLYGNHNGKKKSGQCFRTAKKGKVDKDYGMEGVSSNEDFFCVFVLLLTILIFLGVICKTSFEIACCFLAL